MNCLPKSGRISCTKCFKNRDVIFDSTKEVQGSWRITSNPMAWGNTTPEVVVLGFSKGPTQVRATVNVAHNEIAYKGSRLNVGRIMAHVGLIEKASDDELKRNVDKIIEDSSGRFHFGSLIRCTVERFDKRAEVWKKSGGGMLDKFISADFGHQITENCASQFLSYLPKSTKLVLMFGMGTKQNYVREAFELFKRVRLGTWHWINDVSYTDSNITVVHVEHFASQGALIPNWLGKNNHDRAKLGVMSRDAVQKALRI